MKTISILHSSGPVTGDIEHLLNKEPILSDLVNWLNDVRDEWANLGRRLGVSEADIKSIPEYRSNADKLASILNTWKTGMTSHHTIRKLLDVLKLMGKTEVIKKIREDLQIPDVAKRYSKQPDYKPYEEF